MDKLDLPDALDVIYSYIVDDASPTFVSAMGEATFRHETRERLDTALNRPLDPDEAKQYDRERWGMQAGSVPQAVKDETWGKAYGEPH